MSPDRAPPKSHSLRKRKARKPTRAQSYDLDLMRAAREGVDISGMAPEERCRYPSKFCPHKRAVKTTGKLHRFCELHRERANVNQKRWTEIRRAREHSRRVESGGIIYDSEWMAAEVAAAEATSAAEVVRPLLVTTPVARKSATPAPSVHPTGHQVRMTTTSNNGGVSRGDSLTLSDDEIDQLMSLLVKGDDKAPVPATSRAMELHSGVHTA